MLSANQRIPDSIKGLLDLREVVLDDQSIFDLDGEWMFYWEALLTPENYIRHEASGIPVTVPSYWKSYKTNGKSLSGWGYGTYSLKLILPGDFHSEICMDIPLFDVAYKLFLNGKLVSKNGSVGTSREEEKPWYKINELCFTPESDTLHILIQVSNFHHRRGGFWQSLVIGSPGQVLKGKERQRMYDYSTIGVLFFFMIFSLIFWSFTRKEALMLIFALTTLGMLIRSVNTGLYLSNLFVDTSWSWQIRMEYLGSYLAQLFGIIFLHKVFPRPYMNRIIQVNTILMVLASISLFILPVHLFTYEMLGYQPLLFLFLAHYLVISFTGTIRGRGVDAIFFASLSFMLLALINDILLANSAGSVSATYLSQISFQVVIFAMAVMVIIQWVHNNMERMQLDSSLRFKNKVLSVIAHDLKNPVASVAQFSELLAGKPELAAKKHVVNSLRESSQAALTLLDNLLYWGRSESDKLQINPAGLDLERAIRETEVVFQHMAIQKGIEFSTDIEAGIKAYADPVFVNIVLRNLLANAIKFTRKGGAVRIRAWQEINTVFCSVADSGIGMKPEYLKQIRKEGYLDSTTGTDQEIGTGLGLQLVKDLLEKNNGTLEIESKEEVGSTFTFSLPLYKEDRDAD
ncbi:MAG: HAMP domain-containing sensor histidine kinase [Bacteroidales bacterium]|nr:HAMP domain-containing sensor histidine kinase [Bacteroidales bacterium]